MWFVAFISGVLIFVSVDCCLKLGLVISQNGRKIGTKTSPKANHDVLITSVLFNLQKILSSKLADEPIQPTPLQILH